MSNKIDYNVMGDIYWAVTQARDNDFLEKLRPNVICWETNPPDEGKTGREETVVWVTDLETVSKIPNKLFGLPTTIVLEKPSYRDPEQVIVKVNKLSIRDRFEDFFHTELLVWIKNIFGRQ